MSLIIILFILILLKLVTIFIDSIVGQMHIQIVHIAVARCLIFFSRETRKTLFMPIYSQRVYSVKKSIDAQIEL